MKTMITLALVLFGLGIGIYGWKMKSMTVSHEETRYRTETETRSTKARNAAIGAGIGGIAAGVGAFVVGGIGVVACGTGVGAPAGVGLIAAATLIGAGGGAVTGAATGETETITKQVPYTVTITLPKYSVTRCNLVFGLGIGIACGGVFILCKKNKKKPNAWTSEVIAESHNPKLPE